MLSVMLSRARHGVIVSRAASVPTNAGRPISRNPSSFLSHLASAGPRDAAGLVEWFNSVSWADVAAR